MVPPAAMLATKNRSGVGSISLLFVALWLAGCTPPGPRALLDGKRSLDEGRIPEAVEQLSLATSLMPTNAAAWNYLGLACHRAGDGARAAEAYQRALVLNRELFEAHYNLGCLRLDQNKSELARSEFTACTLRRANSVESWLQLGTAQYRLGESANAEESFQKVLRLTPNHPEALNGMGLVQLQRHRPREAAQHFASALKQRPGYRPALLNLATVSQRDLNDPTTALQKYREYLALSPRSGDWAAVNAVVQSLEQRVATLQRPAATNHAAPMVATANATKPSSVTTLATPPPPQKTNPPLELAKPSPAATSAVEVVKVPPEPVIKTSPSPPGETSVTPVATQALPATPANPVVDAPPKKPEKPGFFARLNPFRRDAKPTTKSTPPPKPVTIDISETTTSSAPGIAMSQSKTFPRYKYQSPATPTKGNRAEAERAFAQGVQAQRADRTAEAAQAFLQATQLDGSYFEAHYSLGLARYALRNYFQALTTWENALAIRNDSIEARYNFALTLKAAGYAPDAAAELERILAAAPDEMRAHLVLGNLFADSLRDSRQARVHYQRLLELDPRHPQATNIRYWLVANPP